jgi:hypothetical protein
LLLFESAPVFEVRLIQVFDETSDHLCQRLTGLQMAIEFFLR